MGDGGPPVHPRVVPAAPGAGPVAQALSLRLGAGAMPAPESRSVFEAAQDPVLLRGLTLVTGVAEDAWAAKPAPLGHGAWGPAGEGGYLAKLLSARPKPPRRSSGPSTACVAAPELGHGSCLLGVGGKWAFLGVSPRFPNLLLQP